MNPLIGKIIKSVQIAEDREAIKFELESGESIIARTDGDCCSHTWIEDVFNPENIIGNKILEVENIELPEEWKQRTKTGNYEEEMEYYGCRIVAEKGNCVIAYRNSSNGYYGGSLTWPNEYYYGGVHGQNKSDEVWKELEN